MFLAPDFGPSLAGYSLRELEAAAHTVVGLRPDYSVGYRNGAWSRFAADNDAVELAHWNGKPITVSFAPPIRRYYEALFVGVQESGQPVDHDYECSSAAVFRWFRLRILPLRDRALLLLHHLRVEEAHTRPAFAPDEARYRDPEGIVTQCCHCRRTRRATDRATWDWVPAYLDRRLPQVSHGLCPPCFRHYFPTAAASWDRRQLRAGGDSGAEP